MRTPVAVFSLLLFGVACSISGQQRPSIRSDPQDAGPEFHVSVDGLASNDGTWESPWDLATALAHPSGVTPGSTIWIHGGTYRGAFVSTLTGTAAAPIVVSSYPGETAVIDGNLAPAAVRNVAALTIRGAHAWFRDFTVTNSDPVRTVDTPGSNPPERRGTGVDIFGPHTKLINCVIHNTGQGVGVWHPAENAEVYGNVIYYNGWESTDRGHGHGIYSQNAVPTMRIHDNIVFEQFSMGLHHYAQQGPINFTEFEGNVVFNNGGLSRRSGFSANILCGGTQHLAEKNTFRANYTYFPEGLVAPGNNFGYRYGCKDTTIEMSYFAGGGALGLVNCRDGLVLKANTFYGGVAVWPPDFPSNRFYREPNPPPGPTAFLRPNRYQPGRATLIFYNWERHPQVSLDLADLPQWAGGDTPYQLFNVQNLAAGPYPFTRSGTEIQIALSDEEVEPPVGDWFSPRSTFPKFAVFLLIPEAGGPSNLPLPAARRPAVR